MRGLLAALAALLVGCTMVPVAGQEHRAVAWGRSCVVVEDGTIIAESDGLSQVVGDVIRSVVGIVGSVFGGARSEDQPLQSAEGCWGVLESAGAVDAGP